MGKNENKQRLFWLGLIVLTFLFIQVVIFCFEIVLRNQQADFLDRRISVLEELVRSNAVYNKSLFEGFRGREREAHIAFNRIPHIPTVYRPYIEWRRRPNFKSSVINLNSLSYRGREFEVKKPKNVFRVLIYGGSFVWGSGALKDDETIAGHLERILNDRVKSKKFEVINAGETGFNSTQETIFLMIEGLYLQPDLVIFVDGVNDTAQGYQGYPAGYPHMFDRYNKLLTGNVRRRNRESFTVDNELTYLKKQRDLVWSPSYFEIGERVNDLFSGKDSVDTKDIQKYTTPTEFALRHFYNLRIVNSLGKEFDFDFLAVIQPVPVHFKPLHHQEKLALETLRRDDANYHMELSWWEKYYNEYADMVASFAKKEEVPVYDLRRIFENDDRPFYIDDCHLTGDGYKVVAEKLFEALNQSKLIN